MTIKVQQRKCTHPNAFLLSSGRKSWWNDRDKVNNHDIYIKKYLEEKIQVSLWSVYSGYFRHFVCACIARVRMWRSLLFWFFQTYTHSLSGWNRQTPHYVPILTRQYRVEFIRLQHAHSIWTTHTQNAHTYSVSLSLSLPCSLSLTHTLSLSLLIHYHKSFFF